MATTMRLIAKSTLGADAASYEFTSIPATYTDLYAVMSARGTRNATLEEIELQFNGSTSNRSARGLYGTGAATGSNTHTVLYAGTIPAATGTADTFGSTEVYIPNYAGSTNKSYSLTACEERNAASTVYIYVVAGLWSDTSAITSLKFVAQNANFKSGSSFFLYGISKA